MPIISRRTLLSRSVAAAAAGALLETNAKSSAVQAEPVPQAAKPRGRPTPADFRKLLRGPILSFPTCYSADLKLDWRGMSRVIETGLKAGVGVVTLTAGNNQYDRLSYDEIKALTRHTIETVAGRALTMAATPPSSTERAVDYARHAAALGADAIQVSLPSGGDEDSHFKHVRAVAACTKLALTVHGQPSLALMKRLLALGTVVGFKEEFTTLYTLPFYREFGDRLNIYAGGEKARFLTYYPYGMQAYYSTFATFAPEVAVRFWKAVQADNLKEAGKIVLHYEVPFFERFSNPFWRATLECFGIALRWVRPPERSYSDKQVEEVKGFYRGLGLG
jgi:dihydrodipicolinate synthase/N-acetylneuraminate lyase